MDLAAQALQSTACYASLPRITAGGWLAVGETFEACAVRELEEETGISCDAAAARVAATPPSNNLLGVGDAVSHTVSVFVELQVGGTASVWV